MFSPQGQEGSTLGQRTYSHKDLSSQKPVSRRISAKVGQAHSEGALVGFTSQVGSKVFSVA